MAQKMSTALKERLKETFGNTTQEEVGRILGMTQGNVSKLMSGAQIPACDTLVKISEVYGVSVDWLLGVSDVKTISKNHRKVSYKDVVEAIHALYLCNANLTVDYGKDSISLKIEDPLLHMLVKKTIGLYKADYDLCQQWKEEKLTLFSDKEILNWRDAFETENVRFLASEASNESEWLQVYEEASRVIHEFMEMMNDGASPFER